MNVEITQIDTHSFNDVPGIMAKINNNEQQHAQHTEYMGNVVTKITADMFDKNWQNVDHTVPIPNDGILQKFDGNVLWDTIGSI